MSKAKAIMVQGTGSGVGKSVLVSALCRIFLQDGYSVAPFKSQNMALNSFVTENGGEIGRAQATQALAAKIKPTVEMNPVLIKPTADTSAQIILMGQPVNNMSVYEYKNYKKVAFGEVKKSFKKLSNEYDIIVIEGAGSPAEVNLREDDIVNMKTAEMSGAPVILVGDIDKGGVFAWVVGTLQLLTEKERAMVKGIIINKFRGDKRLLRSGITFLEKYTGIKVLGVIPYFHDIKIPEEDSVPLETKSVIKDQSNKIKVSVIYLPHISNFTDFDALEMEQDVSLRYIKENDDLADSDVIIIPGTKNTIGDLKYLKKSGLAQKIISEFAGGSGAMLMGICGGYQMLGGKIYDKDSVESKEKEIAGLGVLPVKTYFSMEKKLSQVNAEDIETGSKISGYEIHHGLTEMGDSMKGLFRVYSGGDYYDDGAVSYGGRCLGTYLHGIFDNDIYRRNFLNKIRKEKGWTALKKGARYDVDKEFEKLARHVRRNLNMKRLYSILNAE
ncbi:MAG: cobyric acid synthase [Elusimicrobiota bacterium]